MGNRCLLRLRQVRVHESEREREIARLGIKKLTFASLCQANPSHLETVNTVTLGRARAKQYYLGNTAETRWGSKVCLLVFPVDDEVSTMKACTHKRNDCRSRVMPILFHGEAWIKCKWPETSCLLKRDK